LVSLGEKAFSKALKIKTAGVKEEFCISQAVQGRTDSVNDREFKLRYKKYDFVFNTYLSLAIEDDFLYTKIVQVAPKFVVVNKMRTQIWISQEGCEHFFKDVLNPNDRKEWVWPSSLQPERMVVKKPDYNPEMEFLDDDMVKASLALLSDKTKKRPFLWSKSFKICEIGQMSIQIRRKGIRVNLAKNRKIIKIFVKLIDSTYFVIFEDESVEDPYYRVENGCKDLSIFIVQDGFDMREQGIELAPLTSIPYAFIDWKEKHTVLCEMGSVKEQ